jgi:hypothetical protein
LPAMMRANYASQNHQNQVLISVHHPKIGKHSEGQNCADRASLRYMKSVSTSTRTQVCELLAKFPLAWPVKLSRVPG